MFQMMTVAQIERESIVGLHLWKHKHNLAPRLIAHMVHSTDQLTKSLTCTLIPFCKFCVEKREVLRKRR